MSADLPREPDRAAIATFVEALFRYADDGTFLSLRAFCQSDHGQTPPLIRGVQVDGEGLGLLIDSAVAAAGFAANAREPMVFCPPIATFRNDTRATEEALACGLALSVELDRGNTQKARERLEGLLGPATVVVTSGGSSIDLVTGTEFLKLHMHWRLSEPTRDAEDHAKLKQARRIACALVDADASAQTPEHPMRWPGSWHLKGTPRLARIVALNPDAEVHLVLALEALEDAAEAAGAAETDHGAPHAHGEPQADIHLIESAMAAIPNDDEHWDIWIKYGLCIYRATDGSPEGLEVWRGWSAKSITKFVPGACEERWDHFRRSPPTRIGAGTIFFDAKAARWTDPRTPKLFAKTVGWRGSSSESPPPPENKGDHNDPTAEDDEHDDATASAALADSGLVTEGTVADAFTRAHCNKLRYDHNVGRWYVWSRTRWKREETQLAYRWAHLKARALAVTANDPKTAIHAGKAAFAAGVERLAQSDRTFAVTHDHWDRDHWLLGTPAGTVDLRTGTLRPASRDDYITKQTAVAPADMANCAMFLAFLQEATGGDEALIAYLQRWFGYCLTGDTREHALQFVYGPGGNGKSVLMNTIFGIMGDYAVNAAMETFVVTHGDKHPTDLAMLAGARFVMTTEVEEGQVWAEARIKALTGGDPMTARFMRQDFFTFVPRFKLTISGNHKPNLRNVDDATRRRFNIVPFVHKPKRVDRELADKLRLEWPQILRWMIEGCLEWQQCGLDPPPIVTEATDEYFRDQNVVRHWIEECCDESDGLTDTSEHLFKSWSEYAAANGEQPRTTKWLTQTLIKQGFNSLKDVPGHRNKRGFQGIQAKSQSTGFATQKW